MQIIPLSPKERALIHNPSEIPILEMIKGMSQDEMAEFKQYYPKSLKHYNDTQVCWLDEERYLISTRPGHQGAVSDLELMEDVRENRNSERFMVWYTLMFPHMVERRD